MRLILLASATLLVGAKDANDAVRFIACPVYRDTDAGRKSGCWLASDPASGIRYDVTAAPTKPDWNHAILVEGFVEADAGDPCGGTVLGPARVSVLDVPCTRHLIKAEGYAGRRFALPERNVRPLYEARKKPEPPFQEARFTIPFDYQGSFVVYQLTDYYVDATINYALDVQPATIEITGHAQTTPQSVSGETLVEPANLADTRAKVIQQALVMRGVPIDRIRIVDRLPGPFVDTPFDGLETTVPRRVDVRIRPD